MMTCIAAAMMFAASVCGACDANLADFPRLAGETDDSPRFARAISAAPNGVLSVPKGEYDIAPMILITNRCSLSMHPAAIRLSGMPLQKSTLSDSKIEIA